MSIIAILRVLLLTMFGSAAFTFNKTVFVKPGYDEVIKCPFKKTGWDNFRTNDIIVNCENADLDVSLQYRSSINVTKNCNLLLMNFSSNIQLRCLLLTNVPYTVDVRQYGPPTNITINVGKIKMSETRNVDVDVIECAANETCVLNCSVHSGEPLETLSLSKNNTVLQTGGPGILTYPITPNSPDELVVYSCEARNTPEMEPLRAEVQLKIIGLPDAHITVYPNTSVEEGTRTTLYCNNHGIASQTDTYMWKMNGFPINILKPTLTFERISQVNTGEYECRIRNIGGEDTQSVNITVKEADYLVKHHLITLPAILSVFVVVVCSCLMIASAINSGQYEEIECPTINIVDNEPATGNILAAEDDQEINSGYYEIAELPPNDNMSIDVQVTTGNILATDHEQCLKMKERNSIPQESQKLCYVEIEFDEQPPASSTSLIRGVEKKTSYSQIDFNATAEPTQ